MEAKSLYAVIGYPIAHSLSPQMQNAGFAAYNLSAEYAALEVAPENVGIFAKEARTKLAGFNITVPHKSSIIPFLDEIEPSAARQESVNTVINCNGVLSGYSTDGYGLEEALKEAFSFSLPGKNITFIGCGGVVKALAFHFASRGVRKLFFLNRTVSKAEALAGNLQENFPTLELETAPLDDREKIRNFLENSHTVIQCTSCGLKKEDPPPIPPELLPSHIFLYDTIYKNTPLLQYARDNGIASAGGLSMLLHQGAKAFSLWTGREAPLEVMRRALWQAAGERGILE